MADLPRASAGPQDLERSGAIIGAFAVDLLRRSTPGKNVVVSPTSIVTALAMARPGARGATGVEMDAVLHVSRADELTAAMNALDLALSGVSGWFKDEQGDTREVTLRSVNAPFAQRGLALVPTYLDVLASRFGAGLRLVDYKAAADAARKLINTWVSARTEGRIPELLARETIAADTRLVLVNAIYLKAPWATPFDAGLTKPARFTRVDGSSLQVPTMHLVSSGLGPQSLVASGDGWKAARLPYLGQDPNQQGGLAMTIVVPDDLPAFERQLDATLLADLCATAPESGLLEYRKLDLSLPRFSLTTSLDLADTLKALGMPLAFEPVKADFSGITTQEPLYIAKVIHQANIDVDEKGTEAAAATAVVMRVGGPGDTSEPFVLKADRPFLFLISDVRSGAILFVGRVMDPTAR